MESDAFIKVAVEEYGKYRNTEEWKEHEQYKWEILPQLNIEFLEGGITESNVLDKIEILRSSNPGSGSFVYWGELDNLKKAAEARPDTVISFFRMLVNENIPFQERIDTAKENLKNATEFSAGTPLIGYILAAFNPDRYPIFKNEIFRNFQLFMGLEFKIGKRIGDKYAKYVEICETINSILRKNGVVENPTVMDGQDFLYCIDRHEKLKYKIHIRYLFEFAKKLEHFENNIDEFLTEIKQMDRKHLESIKEIYRDDEKINKIRFLVLEAITQNREFSLNDFSSFKEKVASEYETNILQNWRDFTILFQLYYRYHKERINNILASFHSYLRGLEIFNDIDLSTDKAIKDFSHNQQYGTADCWIALIPASRKDHKTAPQLSIHIYHDEITYGLYIGQDLSISDEDEREDEDIFQDANEFDLRILVSKFQSMLPEFKKINESIHAEVALESKAIVKDVKYWKIAPGRNAWDWENCRDEGHISIGWDEFDDLSEVSRLEFNEKRDALIFIHPDWKREGLEQVWKFAKEINVGDHIVANRGISEVLGIGTVIGPYRFMPGVRHSHSLPVQWDDLNPRQVNEPGWRRTLIQLSREKFDYICNAPAPGRRAELAEPFSRLFRDREEAEWAFDMIRRAFELLRVTDPEDERFSVTLPDEGKTLRLNFGNWAVLHFSSPDFTRNRFGIALFEHLFSFEGEYGKWSAFTLENQQPVRVYELPLEKVRPLLTPGTEAEERDGLNEAFITTFEFIREHFRNWTASPYREHNQPDIVEAILDSSKLGPLLTQGVTVLKKAEKTIQESGDEISGEEKSESVQPEYTLDMFMEETGFRKAEIESWRSRLHRKKHIVFQGPPGTGKTFVAERLARMMVSNGHGFWEVVQFHPAYSYEDFIQGIHPEVIGEALSYSIKPGRFLDFCRRARDKALGDRCVLIIDEINRAHLSRVFGELMYLLEYRKKEIPLAVDGELFRIPENVYIIGTMNTADRSIALVDHALRRRFSFIRLNPDYRVLGEHLEKQGYSSESLIDVLKNINHAIGNPNYEIGISFFMGAADDLRDVLPEIWKGEIEPYLEEFFYDNPKKVDSFRWDNLIDDKLKDWVE